MTTILLKGGTTAQWAAATQPLALREVGVDIETGDMKVGDGLTLWLGLEAVNGQVGPAGPPGIGLPDPSPLPDGYVAIISDGEWSAGPGGAGGGREVQLRATTTYIQWRYAGDAAWQNLVALADLKGAPGTNGTNGTNAPEPQLRVSGGYFQYKLATSSTWTNLIAVSDVGGGGASNFVYLANSTTWQARGSSTTPKIYDAGNEADPPWPSDIQAGDHIISKNPMVAP